MPKYVYDRMPMTLHDFGEAYMTDWEIELYDAILAARLPEQVEWCGDELIADVDADVPKDFDLAEAINEAWEEFCGLDSREKLIEAAERYNVDLPGPCLPMYYEDAADGNDVRDVKGERIRRLSDITDHQYVIVETNYDAEQEDATRDDINWYKVTQVSSMTYSEILKREIEEYGEPCTVSGLIERGGIEDSEDEEILVYEGSVASVTPEEPCRIYIPTYWTEKRRRNSMKITMNEHLLGLLNSIGANGLKLGDEISLDFFTALKALQETENPRLNFYDIADALEIGALVDDIRRAGIVEFSLSETSPALMGLISEFVKHGCTLAGMTRAKYEYPSEYSPKTVPALLFKA